MFYTRSTTRRANQAGFSFVEILVTVAIVSLVFGGLFAAVQAMVALINDSKGKAGATALAVERMEYIRSLQYDAVGTVSGVPAGLVPQTRTVTLNNLDYSERVLIEYVDDPADGFGGADSNFILNDYKRIKVEMSWPSRAGTSSMALVSNMVPQGIESTAGGGTIRAYVYDATSQPVAGATVQFVNTSGTTTINTPRISDSSGVVFLGGAPAQSNYEIYVSRPGYSEDSTYIATGTLSSPVRPLVSVVESTVSTETFFIDEVSTLRIETVGVPTYATSTDSFVGTTSVATTSAITQSGGDVTLAGGPGSYVASGTILTTYLNPSPLASWYSLDFTATSTASTSVIAQLYYDAAGVPTILPDSALANNSVGFTSGPIDLTSIDASTYSQLAVNFTLATVDSGETPTLEDWTMTHVATQTDLAGIDINVTGAKSIGTDASSQPVFKFSSDLTTDGAGEIELIDLEYDSYTVTVTDPTYSILSACPANPLYVAPDSDETMILTLANVSGPLLPVTVTTPSGAAIANASVRLESGSYDETQTTDLCGQTTFYGGGLFTASTYTVTVDRSGYVSEVVNDVDVSSTSTIAVQLSS